MTFDTDAAPPRHKGRPYEGRGGGASAPTSNAKTTHNGEEKEEEEEEEEEEPAGRFTHLVIAVVAARKVPPFATIEYYLAQCFANLLQKPRE